MISKGWADRSLIVFDLDGTLTERKKKISKVVCERLVELNKHYNVGIISGCSFNRMGWQFIDPWFDTSNTMSNFNMFLLPTSGAEMRIHGGWVDPWKSRLYENDFTLIEKFKIMNAFNYANQDLGYPVECDDNMETIHGEIVDDRGGQVTFSMIGFDAPVYMRDGFDNDYGLRNDFAYLMQEYLGSDFSIKIGGSTSIDVNKKDIDKSYGLVKLLLHLKTDPNNVIYFGDKFDYFENDEPILKMGIKCVNVEHPDETLICIEELIKTKGELCDL